MLDQMTQMRLTGLSTGLDTDAIIKNLGRVHTLRIDTVKRDRQYVLWQQESMRNTINMINDFMRSNLNITNPASNFRSATAFAKFNYSVSMGTLKTETAQNAAANILSVSANADLRNFNQTVQQVSQLASRDTWNGGEAGLREITTNDFDLNKFVRVNDEGIITSVSSATFVLSVDNVSRTITLDGMAMRDVYNNGSIKDVSTVEMSGKWDTTNINNHHLEGSGGSISVADFIRQYQADPTMTDADIAAFLNDPANADLLANNGFDTAARLGTKQERSQAFADALNAEIARQFGRDFDSVVKVTATGEITFSQSGSSLTISETLGGADTLRNFGISGGATTGAVGSRKLSELYPDLFVRKDADGNAMFDESGNPRSIEVPIFINGTRITLSGDDTLNSMMGKINASDAGVTLTYNSAADRFELTSKQEGTAANIGEVTGTTAQFLEALNLGKTVDVERQFSDGTQTIWAPGKKFVIGGEFIADLMPGERLVIPPTSSGNVNTNGNVTIASNGDIVVSRQINETLGNVTRINDPSSPNNGKFEWQDSNGDFHYYDNIGYAITAIGGTMAINLDTGLPFQSGDSGTNIAIVKSEDASVTYTRQADGSFTNGGDTFANMNEVLKEVGIDLGNVGSRQEGQNLRAVINGAEFIRQSNSFTHEGMTYTFHNLLNEDVADWTTIPAGDTVRIDIAQNTSEIIEGIRGFVEEYNNIMRHLNSLLSETRTKEDRQYRPLTDDEKKAMTEDEIKMYEDRAKIGMMANDTDLRRLQNELRQAIYTKVEGVGLTMSDIGITTSPNWKDGGILVINEDKLHAALESNYDGVVQLFTQQSDIPASDIANRGQRSTQTGIAQRINDIMNDAVRTTRDSNNRKGSLIERAGIENDQSVAQNRMTERVQQYDKRISTLLDRWLRQENSLYAMFARMETAMMKMQSQQSNLAQLMAQNGM